MPKSADPIEPTNPDGQADTPQRSALLFAAWCEQQLPVQAKAARAARSATGSAGFAADAFADASLLELQFADGSVFYTDPQSFAALHLPPATRTATGTPDRVLLPFNLAPSLAEMRGGRRGGAGGTARGTADHADDAQVTEYRLAKLVEPNTLDRLYNLGALFADGLDTWFGTASNPAAAALAGKLCRAYETAVLDNSVGSSNGRLLYWAGADWAPVDAALQLGAADKALLLLHGTASSTRSSFGGLWRVDAAGGAAAAVADDFRRLAQDTLLLAFEHRSLTASPLRNVLDLLQALRPLRPGCVLSLLSHSRGGLVGECLSLALAADSNGAAATPSGAAQQVAAGLAALDAAYPADHPDLPLLHRLAAALTQVAGCWRAGTFVRVACPARGTLLADRRTDLFLSLLLRSLGLALGNGTPAFEAMTGLVRGLVASRADARTLPGLEAMIPGAPLSVALNTTRTLLPGRLRVVAGDSQAAGWRGLFTLLGDVFYGLHDHDFVVHTTSMFGGVPRADARSLRVEDSSVTHFGYFKPGGLTRSPILAQLAGSDSGFRPMAEDQAHTRGLLQLLDPDPLSRRPRAAWLADLARPDAPRRPILVVLPGIMGSELATGARTAGSPVWLSLLAMLQGQLALLDLAAGSALQPTGLMAVAYERLLQVASQRFNLVTFAFDWRKSITEAGDALFILLRDTLLPRAHTLGVPVHVMAHSMGGLVARLALFKDSPAGSRATLWPALTASGSRLLQLGTPNQGSYAPVQLLLQQHRLGQLVGVAAARVSAQDLAHWGASYPGLMAMLPAAPDVAFGNLFEQATWAKMQATDGVVTQPNPAVLAEAASLRRWLDSSFARLKQDSRVLYVAGQGTTPQGVRVIRGAGGPGLTGAVLRLGATPDGDGTVAWTSTLLPERTWYVDCSHGVLLDQVDAFEGYFELLAQGRSTRLSQQPPATRAVRAEAQAQPLMPMQALPSLPCDLQFDPAAYVLGMTGRVTDRGRPAPIEVSVVHGSLDYARHPLMVGHYQNDGLFGAVARVDAKLSGQLSRALQLKLFEGAERTAVYLRPTTAGTPPAYPGAIVLGLGTVGTLTPAVLADTVTRSVLRYAFDHVLKDPWVAAQGPITLQLSALLIGTHVQAVTPRDSLAGVLQGVWRAGQILANDDMLGRSVRVGRLELVEIEESVALDAAYELRRLLDRQEWRDRVYWATQTLETRDGGLRGFKPSHAESVWQRLGVRHDELGGLRFELIAERARVESTQVQSDVASLTQYIARVSDEGASAQADPAEQASLGRVLYQLLLPQTLKSRLLNFENTVLVLDDKSAALPWELLTPPHGDGLVGDAARPLAVQAGMVRQRTTFEFRTLPRVVEGWAALVVGAPGTGGWHTSQGDRLPFPDLPGARLEAQEVARLLAADQPNRSWDVQPLAPGASFERVRTALLQQPWRVLHLCGHGVVDQWISETGSGSDKRVLRKTGMVLSHQQILTAGDVEQMDPPPEFVFINCCYSGRDGDTPSAEVQRNHPLLASSLALQFIKMGAKAVVAAGWQVDDADGVEFARRLYDGLLDGLGFGVAVREAREALYTGGGARRSNTWGAYQCYGDPDWTLQRARRTDDAASSVGTSRLGGAEACMSAHELATRILQVVSIAGDKPQHDLVQQLGSLVERLRQDPLRRAWLRNAEVHAALGEAYRELGEHSLALAWWQSSGKSAYSALQLRHIELAANSLARLTLPAAHRAGRDILGLLDQLGKVTDRAIGLPSLPADEAAAAAVSERNCLRGSALLRQAGALLLGETALGGEPLGGKRRHAAAAKLLQQAAQLFACGYLGKRERPDLPERRAYALSCAMLSASLGALLRPNKALPASNGLQDPDTGQPLDYQAHTDALLAEMDQADLATAFWHYTNRLELLVARNLLRLVSGQHGAVSLDELAQVPGLIDNALVRWPAPVELESLQHRFTLISQLLGLHGPDAQPTTPTQHLASLARQILQRLREHCPGGAAA